MLLNQTPGRTALIDKKEYLFFSGYSYLGMNHVPEFAQLIKEGIDKYGWIFPSSRISNTQLNLFAAFEAKLSEITGAEDTVCFSSGFVAGRAVVGLVQHAHSYFFSAPHTHPAIDLTNGLQTIGANDFKHWALQIPAHINAIKTANPVVISSDSVNPLTAEINALSFINNITKPALYIIDDSHGAGLINNGKGINQNFIMNSNVEYIITYSLSKAYNLIGGAVSCTKKFADKLRSTNHYTASTSISPAFAYAFLHGQHLYYQQRKRLKKNVSLFKELTDNKLKSHAELPIFVLPSQIDEAALLNTGFIISSFAYPNPKGEKIKRIVLNALHTEGDLQQLADALDTLHHLG